MCRWSHSDFIRLPIRARHLLLALALHNTFSVEVQPQGRCCRDLDPFSTWISVSFPCVVLNLPPFFFSRAWEQLLWESLHAFSYLNSGFLPSLPWCSFPWRSTSLIPEPLCSVSFNHERIFWVLRYHTSQSYWWLILKACLCGLPRSNCAKLIWTLINWGTNSCMRFQVWLKRASKASRTCFHLACFHAFIFTKVWWHKCENKKEPLQRIVF